MNFKKATDELLAGLSHQELADALGVSVPTVRQARLPDDAKAHRNAPRDWEGVIAKLAKQRADKLAGLANKLRG